MGDSDYTPFRSGLKYTNINSRKQTKKYRVYREKYERWPAEHIVANFPIHLDLELSSACNLRCPMCPTVHISDPSFKKLGQDSAMMSVDMFRQAIDEAKQHEDFCSIKLNYRGESTLHPQIVDLIAYARDAGVIDIMLNTNGNYPLSLNEEMVDAGLTWIAFSLDAVRPETYRRCRAGGDFFTAYPTAIDMCRFVDRLAIQVGFVVQKTNRDEVQEFTEFWSRMPVHRILVSDVYGLLGTKRYKEDFCCPQLWQRLVIWNDGRIFACCHAWDAPEDLYLGDVSNTTIKDAWGSEKLQKLRMAHVDGKYREIGTCAKCPMSALLERGSER